MENEKKQANYDALMVMLFLTWLAVMPALAVALWKWAV